MTRRVIVMAPIIALAGAAFSPMATGTRGQARSTAGALAERFADAWNAHNARAFGQLYALDADWVTVAGIRHTGRASIEAALGKEHATWAAGTALRASDIVVRGVGANHAVVMFAWEITGAEGRGTKPLRGNTLMLAASADGEWTIVAGQAASVPGAR